MMEYRIVNKAQFTVMGKAKRINYETSYEEIPKFWKEHRETGQEKIVSGMFAICMDVDGEYFDYIIADDYQPWKEIPEGYETRVIPGGTWAVFPCKGALPKSIHKAVLLNSFLWGIAHLPLIYFGFNYSAANPGAPWSNMAMMILMCLAVGVICCYVTAVSGNAMFAAIVHGVVNIIGEIPVFLSLRQENSLLGPNPTGLIGMAGLILCAMVLFARLGKIKNRLIADPGEQIMAHGKCGCGRS